MQIFQYDFAFEAHGIATNDRVHADVLDHSAAMPLDTDPAPDSDVGQRIAKVPSIGGIGGLAQDAPPFEGIGASPIDRTDVRGKG